MKVRREKIEATPSKSAENTTFPSKEHAETALPEVKDYARTY